MEKLYVIALSVLLAVTVGCCVVTVKKKSKYSKSIFRLLCSGIVAMTSYILFMFADTLGKAMLFDSMYFACTDWMLLCMLNFVSVFSEVEVKGKLLRKLFLGFGVIDTASIMLNMRTGHMFTMERGIHERAGKEYWSVTFLPLHYIHLSFCYVIAAVVFAILIYKIVKTTRMYRKMYFYILIPLVVVLTVNAACYTIDYPIDFSLLFYALLAICICYSALYAIPKGLVEGTLMSVMEDFTSGVICYDAKGKYVYANTKAREVLQVEHDEEFAFAEYYNKWRENNPWDDKDCEGWEESHDVEGQERRFHVEFQRLRDKDKRNVTIAYSFKLTDRTEEIRRFREEQYLATHDRLTGLYNREYFFQKAEQILRRKPDVERYMVCTNIINFKLINDLFGEEMGDRVLVDQAALIKFANYEDCIQGRIGADKFAMLVAKENFNQELAVKNTGRLQYIINDTKYKVQVLIGVYKIEDSFENPKVMYDKANLAIAAPQDGYNKTVVYYDAKMMEQMLHEKTVVNEFEHAIRDRQFIMYLQPLVGADGELKGAEALVRWKHPSRGVVMPIDFIPVTEKTGLIYKLDEYMWDLAAQKLKCWKEMGREDLTISVNVSAKDFYYTDLSKVFIGLVEKYQISPRNLNIEITETVMMKNLDMHLKVLNELRRYGFCIEIDDFGSGYSSLNMLKDVAADILKIDMLFLRETENRKRSRTILKSVISMAKSLEMLVIAEGVETREQMEELREMNCDIFQGYYYSKPVSEEEFEAKYLLI